MRRALDEADKKDDSSRNPGEVFCIKEIKKKQRQCMRDKMSYQLNSDEKFIDLKFMGQTTLEENNAARSEVIKIINSDSIHGVLVDMTEADLSGVKSQDLIKFGESWEGRLIPSRVKFATVVPCDNPFRDKIDISLFIGKTKGIELRVFEEREAAIHWLGF